jgi:hypothetical protein
MKKIKHENQSDPLINKQTEPVFHNNASLPTYWIDSVMFNRREDGITLMRCYTNLPEGHLEQARLLLSVDHLKKIQKAIGDILINKTTALNDDVA